MFISSTVVWDEMNVSITQLTEYPDTLTSTLIVCAKSSIEFKLILKESSVRNVKVNSEIINLKKESGYIIIQRIFNDKDIIEIEINSKLHLVPLKGCDDLAAVMYGKILLAQIGQEEYLCGVNDENINQMLTRAPSKQLSFVSDINGKRSMEFIPLFKVEDEVYSVYMKLNDNFSQNKNFTFAKDGSSAYLK
jgi:DUF1680 family protein